jgi:uncharacterized membrane protein
MSKIHVSPPSSTRPNAPAGHLHWLREEVAHWVADGVITKQQATNIAQRYVPVHRVALARLLLWLGAAFVGLGVIWLVAANLDQVAPLPRLAIVTAFWLTLLAAAEWLSHQRAHRGTLPSPVVGAFRVLATLAFGAVIAQASQSLNVAAFQPKLLGYFAIGAVSYAYLARATGPLVLGVVGAALWVIISLVITDVASELDLLLALFAASVGAIGIAEVHRNRWQGLSAPWREVGWILLLGALFVAALPERGSATFNLPANVIGIVCFGVLGGGLGLVLGQGASRWQAMAAIGAAGCGLFLAVWNPAVTEQSLSPLAWAHVLLAVVVFILTAGWVAVSGTVADNTRMVAIGLVATVIFTTAQSFQVFGRFIQGAWLFIFLGLIFLGTGYAFDRARRQVAIQVESELKRGELT